MAKLKINSTYNLGNGVSYTISAAHRRKSSKKSRWTISTNEEFACFSNSITNTWKQNFSAWGLHIVNSTPDILGKGVNKEDLKVAKFVDVHIPADTRSAFPVISVQSPVSIQCCWQS